MVDYALIGRRIKYYRKQRGKTQAKLAEELEISAPFMSQIERGSTHISLDRLFLIATLLGIKPELLISDANNETDTYLHSDIFVSIQNWTNSEKEWLIKSINVYNQYRHTNNK